MEDGHVTVDVVDNSDAADSDAPDLSWPDLRWRELHIIHLVTLVSFLNKKPMRTVFQYMLKMGMLNDDRMDVWMKMCEPLIQRSLLAHVKPHRQASGTPTLKTTKAGCRFLQQYDEHLPEEARPLFNYKMATFMFVWRKGHSKSYHDPHKYFSGFNDAPGDFERSIAP